MRGFRAALNITLLGLVVTAVTAGSLAEAHRLKLEERVAAEVETRRARIAESLAQAEKSLEFLASLLLIKPSLSSEDFADVASEILLREPAVAGLSWNPRVRPEERASFVAEARHTHPEFRIHAVGESSSASQAGGPGSATGHSPTSHDGYVVRFIEPVDRHRFALGLDIATEAGRRRAVESAIDSRRPAATPPIDLVQTNGSTANYLLIYPAYNRSMRVGTIQDRRKACRGLVVAFLNSDRLLSQSLGRTLRDGYDLAVRDVTEGDAITVAGHFGGPAAAELVTREKQRIDWAGRTWEIEIAPHREYLDSQVDSPVALVWWIGLLATALLAVLTQILISKQRLEIEQAVLRADEERFRLTLGSISDGWWDWQVDADELVFADSWNRGGKETPVAAKISREDYEAQVHAADRRARKKALDAHLRQETPGYFARFRWGSQEPEPRWVLERGSVVARDAEGRPLRMVASILDVTQQVILESEREEIEEHMREAQRLESLGLITSGVAHDFNNWLTTIRNNVAIAREQRAAEGAVEEALREIEEATSRAVGLTSQLLDYSGKGATSTQTVDLCATIDEMKDLLQTAGGKHLSVEFDLSSEPIWIEADPNQIAQVLMNLVTNAADAMEDQPDEKRGRVKLEARPHVIREPLLSESSGGSRLPPGEYARLWVEDNGGGIHRSVRHRIFEPFFTTKATGRGLGLAGVQGIVRRHRGLIQVSSQLGIGTTFEVFLPAKKSPPESLTAEQRHASSEFIPRTILVIDDEDGVRDSLDRLLCACGHSVATAANGQEGIEVLQRGELAFDLAMIDMTMPGLDGLETFRRLRQIHPDLEGVLMSGYSEEEVGALSEGMIGFLQKPFRTEDLIAFVGRENVS